MFVCALQSSFIVYFSSRDNKKNPVLFILISVAGLGVMPWKLHEVALGSERKHASQAELLFQWSAEKRV